MDGTWIGPSSIWISLELTHFRSFWYAPPRCCVSNRPSWGCYASTWFAEGERDWGLRFGPHPSVWNLSQHTLGGKPFDSLPGHHHAANGESQLWSICSLGSTWFVSLWNVGGKWRKPHRITGRTGQEFYCVWNLCQLAAQQYFQIDWQILVK